MSRLRVVSYAINGRGMGHLVRQLAILRWVRRIAALLERPCECWVLTSSEADTLARREGIPALKLPSKAMLRDAGLPPERYLSILRGWVLNAVAGLQPDLLLVDTFPAGSVGELAPVLELARRRVLVARRVRPDFEADASYQALLPLYHDQIVPHDEGTGPILLRDHSELLPRDQARAALGIPDGQRAVYLTLGGGGDLSAADTLPRLVRAIAAEGWHVVVGAGPLYQGPELRGAGITWLDRYTPAELLTGVDAAVAAAGYNSFHELMHAGVPTVFLPLPRIADDQRRRAERAEAAGAGRIAASLAQIPALLEAPGSADAARALVPTSGAKAAALQALEGLIPAADLQLADRVLNSEVMGLLEQAGAAGGGRQQLDQAMELVRLLADGTPSARAQTRAVLLRAGAQAQADAIADPGADTAAQRVQAFQALVVQCGAPPALAFKLVQSLARKFPAARGAELLAACEGLFPCWARFDDWMGAVSLLRAVPSQRSGGLSLEAFTEATTAWLVHEDELFEALGRFTRREGAGRATVAAVLRELQAETGGDAR